MSESVSLLHQSTPAEFEQPGWPRSRALYAPDNRPGRTHRGEPRMLAVPWIIVVRNGGRADWTVFHPEAARAHHERLCQVCGEKLGRLIVLLRGHHPRETTGPGCHPRCAALAVKTCPHVDDLGENVAYLYEGDGLGYTCGGLSFEGDDGAEPYTDENDVDPDAAELTREGVALLAKRDPMGVGHAA